MEQRGRRNRGSVRMTPRIDYQTGLTRVTETEALTIYPVQQAFRNEELMLREFFAPAPICAGSEWGKAPRAGTPVRQANQKNPVWIVSPHFPLSPFSPLKSMLPWNLDLTDLLHPTVVKCMETRDNLLMEKNFDATKYFASPLAFVISNFHCHRLK